MNGEFLGERICEKSTWSSKTTHQALGEYRVEASRSSIVNSASLPIHFTITNTQTAKIQASQRWLEAKPWTQPTERKSRFGRENFFRCHFDLTTGDSSLYVHDDLRHFDDTDDKFWFFNNTATHFQHLTTQRTNAYYSTIQRQIVNISCLVEHRKLIALQRIC